MSTATRLEWLKRVKRKDFPKPVLATSTKCGSSNRVEIADAHSTNNFERPEEFIEKVRVTSDNEKSIERDATLDSPSPPVAIERKDSMKNQTVDSTVAMDLENSPPPPTAWMQTSHGTSFDSVVPMEKCSSCKYAETSLLPLYQNYSLSNDLSGERSPDSFDIGITEEPAISSRGTQYDNILDSILNGDLSMLDDQAILDDSLTTKTTNADLNCLIDFHLPSIDSPPDDSNYSSVRSVDPRLTRKTIGVKDPSLSDGISVTPSVSTIRKKDSLLNGAKGQLSFPSRVFEDAGASTGCSDSAIGDRFGLGTDYTCTRRDFFHLPLLDHSEVIMELAHNDAMAEDVPFSGESLIADCKKLKEYAVLEDAAISTTNLQKTATATATNPGDEVESTISSKCTAETNFQMYEEPRVVQVTGDATGVAIYNLEVLEQSTSLSNVSSTTAYREFLARQSRLTLCEPTLEIAEGSQQHQQSHRLRKCDKLPVKMIQVAQVSSPKSITSRRKLSPRAMENSEQHDLQATFGRSVDDSEESAVKRRKEDSGERS